MQNLFFAVTVLLPAGALALWRTHKGAPGADMSRAATLVTVDGRGEDILLSLAADGLYSIESGRLPVTREAAGGRICFAESRCPGHICGHYSCLSQEYDQAVCMPAGVVVTVERRKNFGLIAGRIRTIN